ncbi:MAG: hypothetical protein V4447_16070 [Pseudomonadota bacterium]
MNTSALEIPTGLALECEIASIEASAHDQRIGRIIARRVALAVNPKTVFISNEQVFSKSRARLMAKFTGDLTDQTSQVDA